MSTNQSIEPDELRYEPLIVKEEVQRAALQVLRDLLASLLPTAEDDETRFPSQPQHLRIIR